MSASLKYGVTLHPADEPAKVVRIVVSIPASMPSEENLVVAGGMAVAELWAKEETLYAVESVEAEN